MPFVNIGPSKLPLFYELHSPTGSAATGSELPTVILVNGWCLSSRYWQETVTRLTANGYSVLTYDSCGFGRSLDPDHPVPADFHASIDSGTQELAELVSKLALRGPFQIVGHSLGGLTACHYATLAEGNGQLAGLTIVNSGSFDDSEPQGSRLNTFVKVFVRLKPAFDWPMLRGAVVGRSVARPIGPYYSRVLTEDLARSDARLALEMSLSSLEPANLQRYRRELQQLQAGLLLIVGDKDATIPPKGMYNIKDFKPESMLVNFADCGHLPMLERPNRFAEALHSFFAVGQKIKVGTDFTR